MAGVNQTDGFHPDAATLERLCRAICRIRNLDPDDLCRNDDGVMIGLQWSRSDIRETALDWWACNEAVKS
jgi:hypothetical protein